MNSLFDFTTHVKGVEYVLALLFIAGYLVYWEVLKPQPFSTLKRSGKEDLQYVKQMGYKGVMKSLGRIAAAPFIGLAYVIRLPFGFINALTNSTVNGIGKGMAGVLNLAERTTSFGWRPTVAYLIGKKKGKKHKAQETSQTKQQDNT